jgi:hypothetical protein
MNQLKRSYVENNEPLFNNKKFIIHREYNDEYIQSLKKITPDCFNIYENVMTKLVGKDYNYNTNIKHHEFEFEIFLYKNIVEDKVYLPYVIYFMDTLFGKMNNDVIHNIFIEYIRLLYINNHYILNQSRFEV